MTSLSMIYKGIIVALFLAILMPVSLHAVSEATVLFLLIEPGSNAGGMGNAYVAKSDDAFAGWWNPAALAFNKKSQVALMHSNWLQSADINDIYYEYLGWDQYFEGIGTVGFNVIYMNYGEQEKTDESGQSHGNFQSYEFAATGSYGFLITEKLAGGLNFKYIYSKLAPTETGETGTNVKGSGSSYAFDIALKFKDAFIPRLDLGWNFAAAVGLVSWIPVVMALVGLRRLGRTDGGIQRTAAAASLSVFALLCLLVMHQFLFQDA
ncbi:MAG TPA: PorV/PorQ family protein, partial [Candidatus Cloacimonadota bacterium]|nr:PorV/PorQ family protein [Candidatus Cloacimonadota bacterium]